MNTSERPLIIGVGNPLRRDDGLGSAVIQQLLQQNKKQAFSAQEHHGEGLSLMEAWQDYANVIIIDATCSNQQPGTLQRFEVNPTTNLPQGLFRYSSHLFGLAEAVALAQSLNRLPNKLVIYGVEGADFTYGEGLTPPVQAAVVQVVEHISSALCLFD